MDALVFPSRTDTFGLVLLEAQASGVPVILGPEAGKHVGVQDGVSGCLCEDFAESIRRLMHDPNLRCAMGRAGRTLASAKGWDMVFARLYETYAEGLSVASPKGRAKVSGPA